MARQFRSDDAQKWFWGFGVGAPLDLTLGTETASWNGTTRFNAYGSTTGTAGTKTLTNPGGWSHKGFHLIHQTCNSAGTNVGNWEIQYINWSLGSNQCMFPLQYSYLTGAQVISLSNSFSYMPRNITVTGTFKPPSWNGATGGIIALMASNSIVVNNGGVLDANGAGGVGNNLNGTYAGGGSSGAGFRGGGSHNSGSGCVQAQAQSGETYTGTFNLSYGAYGNAGGGARARGSNCGGGYYAGGGGGAGYSSAGANGSTVSSMVDGAAGVGGAVWGQATNQAMIFGGGGGGSCCAANGTSTGGGQGGGIILLIAPTITLNTGSIVRANGGAGGANGSGPGSGGGGGGNIVIKGKTVNIGTNIISAQGGAGAVSGGNNGGAGGNGQLAIDYKGSMTGSTTLAGTNYRQDTSLNPFSMGGGAILL